MRANREYEHKYEYGRYVNYVLPTPEGSMWGDEAFMYARDNRVDEYHLMDKAWITFENWVQGIVQKHKGDREGAEYTIGKEVLGWIQVRDPYALYIIIRSNWKDFRDGFLLPDTPKVVLDLVDAILYDKMTEEERNMP